MADSLSHADLIRDSIERRAAKAAYDAGMGASEYEAFLTDAEISALAAVAVWEEETRRHGEWEHEIATRNSELATRLDAAEEALREIANPTFPRRTAWEAEKIAVAALAEETRRHEQRVLGDDASLSSVAQKPTDVCLECDEERSYGHDAECSQAFGCYPPRLAELIRREIRTACAPLTVARAEAAEAESARLAGRVEALEEALRESRDVFVQIAAEPFSAPRGWLVKSSRRAEQRIDAALKGYVLSVEWVEESDSPGWFVCDASGPIEGSYESKAEAESARRALAAAAEAATT